LVENAGQLLLLRNIASTIRENPNSALKLSPRASSMPLAQVRPGGQCTIH
jgi:hypothetical protein